jgi:hypothetical protein
LIGLVDRARLGRFGSGGSLPFGSGQKNREVFKTPVDSYDSKMWPVRAGKGRLEAGMTKDGLLFGAQVREARINVDDDDSYVTIECYHSSYNSL